MLLLESATDPDYKKTRQESKKSENWPSAVCVPKRSTVLTNAVITVIEEDADDDEEEEVEEDEEEADWSVGHRSFTGFCFSQVQTSSAGKTLNSRPV